MKRDATRTRKKSPISKLFHIDAANLVSIAINAGCFDASIYVMAQGSSYHELFCGTNRIAVFRDGVFSEKVGYLFRAFNADFLA